MDPILVTGAAGGAQGATGRRVAERLLSEGHPVRAFVRTDDARADALRRAGAELVVGDLREIQDVLPALEGVRRAYFTYPVTGGMLDAAAAFAAAARASGTERVVAVSQLAAAPDAPTPHMRRHWLAEQLFDRAGIGAVHLRAAVFFENLEVVLSASGDRELALPLGPPTTVLPLIAAADVARTATGLLTTDTAPPEPVLLTGQVLTVGEAAEAFSSADDPVSYSPLMPEEWLESASALYQDPVVVEHLTALWEIFRLIGSGHDLYTVTPDIARYGGSAPLTLREHVLEN